MSLKFYLLATVLFLGQWSYALESKKFTSSDKFPKAINLREYKSTKKLKKLSQIQWHAINGNWGKCAELSETLASNTSLGVWLPLQHLRCLDHLFTGRGRWKVKRLLQSFKVLEKNKSKLIDSPYNGHRDKFLDMFLDLAELASEKSRQQVDALIERNQDVVDYMNESQRAQYYRIMGELAWLRQKNDLARSNFLRSYNFAPNPEVLQRLKQLKADKGLRLNKYSAEFSESDEENKLWGKFSGAVRRRQAYKVAKYGAEFLNKFPGSERVKKVREDVNTFYKRLLYRRGPKYVAIKKDFESELMKAPAQHILYWGTEAYERGYQDSSYKLADKAADKWQGTPLAADALIVAARSAYYLVKRSQAKKYLNRLIEQYSGHEASDEAHYLLGMLLYREGEYKKVVHLYDSFLLSSGSDKWELQVRYWLWRALKKIDSPRRHEIAETIFKIFPLTYYGLIVRMDEKKDLQSLIHDSKKKAVVSYWWTGHTKKRWQRIKKLIELGWLDEAETEIDFMPDPQTADGYYIRGKLWQAALRDNRAIQDYAAAIDLNLEYINRDLLELAFPKKFEKPVIKAEKEFNISRNLIWAIMRQESAFMSTAISPSNAYGLMQLLGGTARETAKWLRVKNFRIPQSVFDPAMNIRFGSHFISRMVRKYKGVIPLAIASYNVGPGNLDRWLSHRDDLVAWDKIGESFDDDMWMDELPWPETSFYVKAVLRNYLLYRVIHNKNYNQLDHPPWKEVLQ